MHGRLPIAILVIFCFGSGSLLQSAQKKKKKNEEEITQTLEVPKDPPNAVVADASRLAFFVSPLSAKGLLSQQIRDALKSLFSQVHGAQIVKIRAFVAGSGDLRRVPSLVSEIFTDKKLALPAVSVVQVGALPLTGAQVLMEAIAVDKKVLNAGGLGFIPGQPSTAKDAAAPLTSALQSLSLPPESVRQVSCFLNALESEPEVRKQIAAAFPKAAAAYVQLRRDSAGDFAECQATAALAKSPDQSLVMTEKAALAGPVRLALTGAQMGFGTEEKDVRLALDRLGKALEGVGASWNSVAATDTYALSTGITGKIAAVRKEMVNAGRPPVGTRLQLEGLPSLDASFAIEATAIVER